MARTLLFLEGLALAALSLALPLIASRAAEAFIIPFALSLVLPLACALSVWPAKSVHVALLLLFPAGEAKGAPEETAAVLETLGTFSKATAALGFLLSLAVAASRLGLRGDPRAWSWLGLYLCLYALVNASLWQALAAVARRVYRGKAGGDSKTGTLPSGADTSNYNPSTGTALALQFGLSRREWETARLIAGGMSYKETAAELGISIKTVKSHMGRVYEKTGAASNVALSLLLRPEKPEMREYPTKVR